MRKRKKNSLRRIHPRVAIDLIRRHPVIIIMVGVALIAAFVVLSELARHRQGTESLTEMGPENSASVRTSVVQTPPPQPARLTSPKVEEQPAPQLSRPLTQQEQQPESQDQEKAAQKQHDTDIAQLEAEQKSLAQQITMLRSEDQELRAWHNEEIQLLESQANQIKSLGSTLHRVLKSPREIRVMATDIQQQASGLRSQTRAQSQTAGKTSIQKQISTEKGNTLQGMASNLDDIALKLHQTQGDPSRVRVLALEIQRKGEELQRTVETKRGQEVPENSQLVALERKYNSLKNRIQELQKEQVAGTQD